MMMSSRAYEPVQTTETTDDLQTSFLVAPPPSSSVTVAGVPQIEVEAPSDLPEGYQFRVTVPGTTRAWMVTVPAGGVEKGQKWTVPLMEKPHDEKDASQGPAAGGLPYRTSSNHAPQSAPAIHIPVGHWRDSLLGVFNYGLCHPHWWTAVTCAVLAGGQVIRRLQFTWSGKPSPSAAASARAWEIVLFVTVFHWFMLGFLYLSIYILDPAAFDEPTEECATLMEDLDYELLRIEYPECVFEPEGLLKVIIMLFTIFKWMFLAITVALLYNVRQSVRAKYAIPGSPVEDCVCSAVCPCLVAAQLLRHTTDYNVYPSQLCTPTGLPDTVPTIV